MKNKNNEAIMDEIIEINAKNKTDQMNYRKVFATYIVSKDSEVMSLIKTITRGWKQQKKLLKELDNYPIEECLIEKEEKRYENMYF
ncbi:MAG: hypothetical protein KAI55_04745 [Candidatus Aenigmarchaeota archaeon]|nr:hypothetical protein [Candidatus Aenigmarchaeota archaeon]